MSDVAAWIGVAVGAAAFAVAVPVLVLAVAQHRRDTERSMVEWIAREPSHGSVVLRNQGLDAAHDVIAEAWDAHDEVTMRVDEVARDGVVRLVLEHRHRHGPDAVAVTRIPRPPVPNDPPVPILVPGEDPPADDDPWMVKLRRDWEQAKALEAISEQSYAERERALEAEQVQVRVTWRSARGRWHSELLALL